MDPEPLAREIIILQNKIPATYKSSHKNPVIRTLS